jgi:hypothetical protein
MIYQEICGSLKRKGVRWKATTSQTDGMLKKQKYGCIAGCTCNKHESGPSEDNIAWKSTGRPRDHTDCAIMRTCRQVHAEFASVLYGSPLELYNIVQSDNVIPISPLYASLVRTVFATAATGLFAVDDLDAWRTQLQTATGLSNVFVNANTLRLGWFVAKPDSDAVTLLRQDPEAWDRAVKEVVRTVKKVKKMSYTPLSVPHNVEVVEMYWTNGWKREVQSIRAPLSEAIRMLRAKRPARKSARKAR